MNTKKWFTAVVLVLLLMMYFILNCPGTFKAMEYRLMGYEIENSPHFSVLYKPSSRRDVPVVISAAEKAYSIVSRDFGYDSEGRIPIIVFPDPYSLQRAFNWPLYESNQGVYYKGAVYIQTPGAWISDVAGIMKEFFLKGPMVHELTHLAVDRLTSGNHPRWFTEGAAQYEEKKVTGYTLAQDFPIDMSFDYSHEEIFKSFDELPDTPKAYMKALEMMTQLAGEKGISAISEIFPLLRAGANADEIFLQRLG